MDGDKDYSDKAIAKECMGSPETERIREEFAPRDFRGSVALLTLILDSWLPNYRTINSCCFKLPSVWQFITAALGKLYNQ